MSLKRVTWKTVKLLYLSAGSRRPMYIKSWTTLVWSGRSSAPNGSSVYSRTLCRWRCVTMVITANGIQIHWLETYFIRLQFFRRWKSNTICMKIYSQNLLTRKFIWILCFIFDISMYFIALRMYVSIIIIVIAADGIRFREFWYIYFSVLLVQDCLTYFTMLITHCFTDITMVITVIGI